MNKTCETCRQGVYRPIPSSRVLERVICHVRSVQGDFPVRRPNEWCGEWKASRPSQIKR